MYPKYSIIIPIYNAEKTLNRCINSLLAEHYTDMELILVNDGSKDSSLEICNSYSDRFVNVRVIEKENGGVSTARNAGLEAATGKYILFVDSDDYVATDFFKMLEQTIDIGTYDFFQFSYCLCDGHKKKNHICETLTVDSREKMMNHIVNSICRKQLNSPCAKLYLRDIIESHQIRFPIGVSVAEDKVFNIKYSMYIQNYAVSDKVLYYINTENEISLTRGRHANLKQQFQLADDYFREALQEAPITALEKEVYQKAYNFGLCRSIYHDAKQMHQDKIGWLQRQVCIERLCYRINRKHMKYPKSNYCTFITLPVRLYLAPVIDVIAWKLTR